MSEKELVYGSGAAGLTFMPLRAAQENVAVLRTLANAKTWGEVRLGMPTKAYYERYLANSMHYKGPSRPADGQDLTPFYIADETPFTPNDVFWYDDWTCFPSHAEIDMSVWMPKEIQEKYGKTRKYYSCGGNPVPPGNILDLDDDRVDEIVADLEVAGFVCREDDDLISNATTFDIDLDDYPDRDDE